MVTPRAGDVAAARETVHGPEYSERCPQRVAAVCAVCRRVAAALATARAEERARCAEIARTYFAPCDEPADISARECGGQIAAAIEEGYR